MRASSEARPSEVQPCRPAVPFFSEGYGLPVLAGRLCLRLSLLLLLLFWIPCVSAQPMEEDSGVPRSAEEVCPLLVGQNVPAVQLRTPSGESFDLPEAVASQPTVVIFYRGGWCPYCNLHLAGLKAVEEELVALGYQLLAVSPDRPAVLQESIVQHDLSYRLLSDSPMQAARAFGIAFRVAEERVASYRARGIDLEADSGQTHHLLPVPSVFIFGVDGVLRFQYVNPNYKVRLHPDVLRAAARAALEQ